LRSRTPAAAWPPIGEHHRPDGWRTTYQPSVAMIATMLPLGVPAAQTRRASSSEASSAALASGQPRARSADDVAVLLCLAGVGCCVAMSMPAGSHRRLLWRSRIRRRARRRDGCALMLGFGIISRVASGFHRRPHRRRAHAAARFVLQGTALVIATRCSDGLFSLYVISALFGLFQGGHRADVRHHRAPKYFSPKKPHARRLLHHGDTARHGAGRLWMSGVIFDLTGSYQAAFLNGIAWNLINVAGHGLAADAHAA